MYVFWTVRFKKRLVKEVFYNYFEKCLAYHYYIKVKKKEK